MNSAESAQPADARRTLLFVVVSAGPWASRRPCFTSGSFERSSRVSGCASGSSCAVSTDRRLVTHSVREAGARRRAERVALAAVVVLQLSALSATSSTYGLRRKGTVLRDVGGGQVGLGLGRHLESDEPGQRRMYERSDASSVLRQSTR